MGPQADKPLGQPAAALHAGNDLLANVAPLGKGDVGPKIGFQRDVVAGYFPAKARLTRGNAQVVEGIFPGREQTTLHQCLPEGALAPGRAQQQITIAGDRICAVQG